MSLIELILGLEKEQRLIAVFVEVRSYLQRETSVDLRAEIPPRYSKQSTRAGEIIRRNNLEYIIFKAVSGYEAQEEITKHGTDGKPGYKDFKDLAYLLSGKTMTAGQIGKYFLELAGKNDMPELTEASRAYISGFDREYVRNIPADVLKGRVPIFAKPVKKPQNYAAFLRDLHKKVKEDRVLQYEILKKWTGIEREDQVTYSGTELIPGYSQLKSLAAFFTGNAMEEKEAGEYFRCLVRTKGSAIKTRNLTEVIMGFDKSTKPSYAAEVVMEYISSMTSGQVRKELPRLHGEKIECSKKIRALKLQYVIFLACTGYKTQSDITQAGNAHKPGYSSLTALASILSGTRKDVTETGKYFRYLARENGMPPT